MPSRPLREPAGQRSDQHDGAGPGHRFHPGNIDKSTRSNSERKGLEEALLFARPGDNAAVEFDRSQNLSYNQRIKIHAASPDPLET